MYHPFNTHRETDAAFQTLPSHEIPRMNKLFANRKCTTLVMMPLSLVQSMKKAGLVSADARRMQNGR